MLSAKLLLAAALPVIFSMFEDVTAPQSGPSSGAPTSRLGTSRSRLNQNRTGGFGARNKQNNGMFGFQNQVPGQKVQRHRYGIPGIFTINTYETSNDITPTPSAAQKIPQDACPLLNPGGESFIPTIGEEGRLIQRRPTEEETKTFTPLTPELLREHMGKILNIAHEVDEITDSHTPLKVQIKSEEDVSTQLFKTTDPDTTVEILRQGINISKKGDKSIGAYTKKITENLKANIKDLKITNGNTNPDDPQVAKLLAVQRDFFALFFVFAKAQQMEFEGKPQYLEEFKTTIDGLQSDLKNKDDCDNAPIQLLISMMKFFIDATDEKKMFTAMAEFLANANGINNQHGKPGVREKTAGKLTVKLFKGFAKLMGHAVEKFDKDDGLSDGEPLGSKMFDD